jgi:hypothetical protein
VGAVYCNRRRDGRDNIPDDGILKCRNM